MFKLVATQAVAAVILIRLMVGAVFVSEGTQKFLYPAEVVACSPKADPCVMRV